MCIYNQMIKNRKYTKNKKNKGNVPTLPDRRVEYVPTGCGNCMECRKQKAQEWRVRLLEDIKTNGKGKMITLTFSNENIKKLIEEWVKKKIGVNTIYNIKTRKPKEIPTYELFQIKELKGYEKDNAIATKALRLFNERWRKEYGVALRHWLITELGGKGTENIHLHGIIWPNQIQEWEIIAKNIETIWKYGFIWKGYRVGNRLINYVNAGTAIYCTKYVYKIDEKHKEYKPVILTTPGIGANYTRTKAAINNIERRTETYKTSTGHEIPLPIYYRNKIFTEESREQFWIQKLDKQERWVDGVKYDIRIQEEDYKKAIKDARRKNIALGYGTRPNENRKEYEEQRREILIQTRIQNASPARQKNIGSGLTK